MPRLVALPTSQPERTHVYRDPQERLAVLPDGTAITREDVRRLRQVRAAINEFKRSGGAVQLEVRVLENGDVTFGPRKPISG